MDVAVVLLSIFSGSWSFSLSRIDRPVLYIGTTEAKLQAAILKQKIPTAQIEIFDDAEHAIFVDDPERFNLVLDHFLQTPCE